MDESEKLEVVAELPSVAQIENDDIDFAAPARYIGEVLRFSFWTAPKGVFGIAKEVFIALPISTVLGVWLYFADAPPGVATVSMALSFAIDMLGRWAVNEVKSRQSQAAEQEKLHAKTSKKIQQMEQELERLSRIVREHNKRIG